MKSLLNVCFTEPKVAPGFKGPVSYARSPMPWTLWLWGKLAVTLKNFFKLLLAVETLEK